MHDSASLTRGVGDTASSSQLAALTNTASHGGRPEPRSIDSKRYQSSTLHFLQTLVGGLKTAKDPKTFTLSPAASDTRGAETLSTKDARSLLVEEIILRKRSALDWEESKGHPPLQSSFDRMLFCIDVFLDATNMIPAFFSSGDGEVGFVWRKADNIIEVAFLNDDRIEWAARIDGTISGGDNELSGDLAQASVPRALLNILSQLNS